MTQSDALHTMDYIRWRNEIFGTPPGSDPVVVQLSDEVYGVTPTEAFDHIDRALVDPEIHDLFSKEQIGVGLNLIYSNSCSDLPFCYTEAGDEARRVVGITNLQRVYSNFFDRYCTGPVISIGNDQSDGQIGFICYMFWDIFVLWPGTASPVMTAAALDVMARAMQSKNENSVVSAIHGLGHWGIEAPQASQILHRWLQKPATRNRAILDYARQAVTGCIL